MKLLSRELVRIHAALTNAGADYMTSRQVATVAGVAERTARHHLRELCQLKVAEREEVFGGFRYRLADTPQRAAFASRHQQEAIAIGESLCQ